VLAQHLLSNLAHALVAKDIVNAFVDWMVALDGGQLVIENFAAGGAALYSKALSESPERLELGRQEVVDRAVLPFKCLHWGSTTQIKR
jgi:hypothetical protein